MSFQNDCHTGELGRIRNWGLYFVKKTKVPPGFRDMVAELWPETSAFTSSSYETCLGLLGGHGIHAALGNLF